MLEYFILIHHKVPIQIPIDHHHVRSNNSVKSLDNKNIPKTFERYPRFKDALNSRNIQ